MTRSSFKCSICGETWDLANLSRARQHVNARFGKCARENAIVLRTTITILPSHRSAGGREVAVNIISEPGVPYRQDTDVSRADSNPDLEAAPTVDTAEDFVAAREAPATAADYWDEAITDLLDILVTEDDPDKICSVFNSVTAGDAPEPGMISDAMELLVQTARPRRVLNYSQRRIVELRKIYKLNLRATNAVIELVMDPIFDVQELRTSRVQTLENRLRRGYDGGDITEYDFHTEMDGKQNLKMYLRNGLQVMEEIFSDPRFKDHLILTFTPTFDENGNRTFGSAMGGLWAQFHMRALKNGAEVLLALALYIDASFVKVNLSVKPVYGMACFF